MPIRKLVILCQDRPNPPAIYTPAPLSKAKEGCDTLGTTPFVTSHVGKIQIHRAASSLRHARDHHPAVPNRLSETLYALSRFVGDSPYDAIRPKPDRTTPTAGSAARLCRSWKLTREKRFPPHGPTRADLPPAWIHRNDDLPRRNHRV